MRNFGMQTSMPALLVLVLVASSAAQAAPFSAGDLVYVDVYNRPELSTTTQLDSSGQITLPGIGTVSLLGMTEAQAADHISKALTRILKNPPRVRISRDAANVRSVRTASMRTELIPLHNSDAESIAETLKNAVSGDGNITFEKNTNTVIVTADPAALQNILAVIGSLDSMQSQRVQVRIETRFAEVQTGAMRELGLRMFAQGSKVGGGYYSQSPSVAPTGTNRGSSNFNTFDYLDDSIGRGVKIPVHVPEAGSLFFSLLTKDLNIGVLLDALVKDNKAEMVAEPLIVTANHEMATFEQIDKIPYTEFGTEISGRSNFSTQFLDVGIKLEVTPHVRKSDEGLYVRLDLKPEVSFLVGTGSGGVPIQSKRAYNGTLDALNAQTVVIGGIYRTDTRNITSGVPGISKIPLFGALFRHKEKVNSKTELLVFVTPTIYDSPSENTWDKMINIPTANLEEPQIPSSEMWQLMRRE